MSAEACTRVAALLPFAAVLAIFGIASIAYAFTVARDALLGRAFREEYGGRDEAYAGLAELRAESARLDAIFRRGMQAIERERTKP